MLDFANKYYLFFLFAIPAIWILYFLGRKAFKSKLKRFGRKEVIQHLMPDVSKYKPGLKLTLRLIALAAIVIALARPRYGEMEDTVTTEGAEIVIAFDVSRSMLAPSTDDPTSISRLERARMLLEKLVGDLHNDKVGLVVFAANARMQMPLTSDRRIVQMAMRNELTPDMMASQGTSLSEALQMATLTFPGMREKYENPDGGKSADDNIGTHRAIILLTDAEDHEGDAVQIAKQVASDGIQIDVIGVGTAQGGKIPLGGGQYLRDLEGNDVVTKLNSEAASQIAEAGNGVYVNASDINALQTLQKSLDTLKKSEFEKVSYKMSAEQFPLFAWIAIAFLILDIIVMNKKTKWLKGVNFFHHKTLLIGICVLGLGFASSCSGEAEKYESNKHERNAIKEGNENYKDHSFSNAAKNYSEALEYNPESEVAMLNLALANFQSNEADSTARQLADSLLIQLSQSAINPEVGENALYNRSNILVYYGDEFKNAAEKDPQLANELSQQSTQLYKQAIEGYKELLRRKPGDLKVTQNLRITQLKLPPEDQNQNNQDQQQQQQQQEQDQQQQQQQQQPQADQLNALQKREAQTRKKQTEKEEKAQYTTDKPW